jgi:baculoviral IAP repeat-containing protein 6
MIGLLRRMSDCELTVQVLIGQRWEKIKSCGIEEWMWGDGEVTWVAAKGSVERAPPLYEHFKKLTKHCEAFLAGASQMVGEAGEEEGDVEDTIVKATSLCDGVVAARDDMERLRAMTVLGNASSAGGDAHGSPSPKRTKGKGRGKGKDKGKGRAPVDMEKLYSSACEKLAFKHATLSQDNPNGSGLIYASYNYATNLNQTASSTRNPKDRLHLIKELAVMATCLPPGVWVRVDDVRNDAM